VKQEILGDTLEVGEQPGLEVSVVCPFFNEEQILEDAIGTLLERLEGPLDASWELIVVNDGSTDASGDVAARLAKANPRLRVLGYRFNRGRGHALRVGIAQARGRVIVTTEIDLSWGEDIVERLLAAMQQHPDADVVIASPHLPGGGYRNVPRKRVLFSRLGNHVIRRCMTNAVTMNTGMTRAYRREVIRSLPVEEDKKEFHLEVVLKAEALGYRFHEIPAILEWKDYKHKGQRVQRKSSSKIKRLVVTHSLFSLFADPIRYVALLSGLVMLGSFGFLAAGIVRYLMDLVSVYMLIISLALAILSFIIFASGIIAKQCNMIQREIWALKQSLNQRELEKRERRSADAPREPSTREPASLETGKHDVFS
jgi:glycosyltransferase involved in cell wall biosynthesis